PAYDTDLVPTDITWRATPDVAYNAGHPVAVYDSYNNGAATPWVGFAGTSAGAPQWAALIAIADQARVWHGLESLDGPQQTLPMIYRLPSNDSTDVTTGSAGSHSAASGFDLVTGRGTPIADRLVADLASQGKPVGSSGIRSYSTSGDGFLYELR